MAHMPHEMGKNLVPHNGDGRAATKDIRVDLFLNPTIEETLEAATHKICSQYGIQQEDQGMVLTLLKSAYYHSIELLGFKRPVVPVNGSQRPSDISDKVYGAAN